MHRAAAAAVAATALAAIASLAGCERTGDSLVTKLPDAQADAFVVPPPDAQVDAGPDATPAGVDARPIDAHLVHAGLR